MSMTQYDKAIHEVVAKFQADLRNAMAPLINAAVDTDVRGSFSSTVHVGPRKERGVTVGYSVKYEPRTRLPGQAAAWNMKLDDKKQLVMFEAADLEPDED